jgi:hypothetical protein
VPGALERVWRRVVDDGDLALEAFERANLALAAVVKDVPQRWNDAVGRTWEDALAAFEEALRLLDERKEAPIALVEDLLDDLDRYGRLPDHLFESSA